MFAQIRRHQKTLWIFISAMVIISFVWYFNPNQRVSRNGGGGGYSDDRVGMINGEPIHRAEYNDAYREAVLHYLFSYGEWPADNEMTRQMRPVERETRNRIFLTRKIKELNIQVGDQAVVDWVMQAFQDRETKQYRYEYYQRFIQNIEQRRLKEADFQRYARHQVAIGHLAAVAGASGKLVTPQEAEHAFREENEKVDTKVALVSLSNYVAQVQVTDDAIAKFYTNRQSAYRLPERLQLTYVEFPASNFVTRAEERLAAETNLNQRIDSVYLQRGPSFYTDPSGQPMAADAAKARIREDLKKEVAMGEARRAAFEFANELATEMEKLGGKTNATNPAEPLEKLAASKGLNSQVTEPFSQQQGPRGLNVPEQFTRAAFQLTPEEPIVNEPVAGEDAFYIIAFKQKVPSEVPAMEAIRDRVVQDFTRSESMSLAQQAAAAFLNSVTNSSNAQQFETAAQQAGLTVVDLPPFSRDARAPIDGLPPQVYGAGLRNTAFELSPGQTSTYLRGSDGGYIVHVEKFIPASDEDVKKDVPAFLQELRRRNAAEAFNDWFAHEVQLARLQLPGDRALEGAEGEQ